LSGMPRAEMERIAAALNDTGAAETPIETVQEAA